MQWTGGQGSSQGGERLAPGDRALRLQATTGCAAGDAEQGGGGEGGRTGASGRNPFRALPPPHTSAGFVHVDWAVRELYQYGVPSGVWYSVQGFWGATGDWGCGAAR